MATLLSREEREENSEIAGAGSQGRELLNWGFIFAVKCYGTLKRQVFFFLLFQTFPLFSCWLCGQSTNFCRPIWSLVMPSRDVYWIFLGAS